MNVFLNVYNTVISDNAFGGIIVRSTALSSPQAVIGIIDHNVIVNDNEGLDFFQSGNSSIIYSFDITNNVISHNTVGIHFQANGTGNLSLALLRNNVTRNTTGFSGDGSPSLNITSYGENMFANNSNDVNGATFTTGTTR